MTSLNPYVIRNLSNGHFFQVPGVVVVLRIDCNLLFYFFKFKFDFGNCDLTFVQFVFEGETATDLMNLGNIATYANLEVKQYS